jgi:DNA helicase-2/ATP-dependent DNA helicase PcrA
MTDEPAGSSTGITPNEQQRKAIEATEDRLRIVAGPGTGKTETLTRRIAYLIDERDVPPESIIAFTFTEKAADELLTRIESHVGTLENRPWVGTIHSFCLDLLEEYRETVFEGDHTILGEEGQLVFLYTHYTDLGLSDVNFPLNVVAAHFSKLMDLGIKPNDYFQFVKKSYRRIQSLPDHRPDKQSKIDDLEERLAIAKSYKQYHQKMGEEDAIDYATMIQQTVTLVEEHNEVREYLSDEYSHLLVDEYQDTNRTQERLIEHLSDLGCKLGVVGDDDQSIYRFRGATVDNLLEFHERYESVRTIPIETNYRSDSSIVDVSQSVIQNNDRRLEKKIGSDSDDEGFVGIIQRESQQSEAATICDYIQQRYLESPGEVAMLFRSVVRDAGPYIDALQDRGIPVEVTGMADVFKEDFVDAALTVVDYLIGEVGTDAVSDTPLLNLCDNADQDFRQNNSISCGHSRCNQMTEKFLKMDEDYGAKSYIAPQEFFYQLLSCFPVIEESVSNHDDLKTSKQLRYLAGLSDLLNQIEEITEGTTLGYLRQILSIVQDQGVDPDLPNRDGGVNVMTVHQAKGLEFEAVIIPSLVEGKFPTSDRPDPLQIPSQLRTEPEYKEGDDHLSDERRLFYVAMTRAENQIILSTNKENKRSQFIDELPNRYLTEVDPSPDLAEADRRFSLRPRNELESTSFTQISYFTQCPLRFGLLFDYGFERTAQPQFYYGISVHRALERFFNEIKEDTDPTKSQLMNALDTEWIDRGYAGDEQEMRFKNKAEEILQVYLRNHEGELDRIEYVEHPFSIVENGVRIEGKMDRVDRLPNGELRVIDFKVGEVEEPGPWESFQLHLYALACERTLEEIVADCRFRFLTSDEPVPIEYNDAVRERTLNRLQSVLRQMENREYSPNPGEYCDRCDFRGLCPAVDY